MMVNFRWNHGIFNSIFQQAQFRSFNISWGIYDMWMNSFGYNLFGFMIYFQVTTLVSLTNLRFYRCRFWRDQECRPGMVLIVSFRKLIVSLQDTDKRWSCLFIRKTKGLQDTSRYQCSKIPGVISYRSAGKPRDHLLAYQYSKW